MPTLREPFAIREFRGMWLARGLSLLGDQLARVALAVLVFDRTGSAALTGAVYGLTYLPYLAGPLIAGLADRRPRRGLMVTLDLARAALVAVMAIPGVGLPVLCVILVAVTAVSPLYDAARSALAPDVLPDDLYPNGLAIMTMTTEGAQVLGFALGGALVATIGARPALAVDAFTFWLSGVVVLLWVTARPAANDAPRQPHLRALREAVGPIFASRWRRGLLVLAWMNAFWMVPEGLAAPYAAQLHHGAIAVGLLLAAIPAGGVVGAVVLGRWLSHEARLRVMRPLAALAAVALIGCAFQPPLPITLALWALCGIGTAYNMAANAAYVQGLPNERRAQSIALAMTGIVAGQGVAVFVGGAIASAVSPATVVAGSGVLALGVLALLRVGAMRTERVVRLPAPRTVELPDVRHAAAAADSRRTRSSTAPSRTRATRRR